MRSYAKRRGMLSGYTVLDLTDEKGFFAGRILGDLGADVIKIEKPGGDPARRIGPFYKEDVNPEKSLYWFAYNANKRGITLDMESDEGIGLFQRMLQRADILVESSRPRDMRKVGLIYEQLRELNSRLIVTSITPFGTNGPYSDYEASDITCMAMGGLMQVTGYPDLPPVRVSAPQAYLQAGAEAAVGTLVALYHREQTGRGNHVDVSIQESVIFCMLNLHLFWESHGEIVKRQGDSRIFSSGAKHRQIWPCKDGYVCFTLMGAKAGAATNKALVEWMESEGMASPYLKNKDWDNFDFAVAKQEDLDLIGRPIEAFFRVHTRKELTEGAAKRDMMFYPVNDVRALAEDFQLSERGFWEEIHHPELATNITYPAHFCIPSESGCGVRFRAPLIGEHNKQVYVDELGMSMSELQKLERRGVI